MQEEVKTWWRRSILEVTSISLEDLLQVTSSSLEVTSTNTNTLVSTRTLLCLPALQQLDQAAGWLSNIKSLENLSMLMCFYPRSGITGTPSDPRFANYEEIQRHLSRRQVDTI